MTIQALRVHAFDQPMQLDEVALALPGPAEVRVRVHAAGVSFFDMLIARGGYQWRPPLPFTVGSEFSGTIEAVGDAVADWRVGDRVCGSMPIGCWADCVCLPATQVYRVDDGQDLDAASVLITTYGTALYALRERGRLRPGETALILGAAGSVGDAAVQVAKLLGARVVAAVLGGAQARLADANGADEVVDMASGDWKDRVKEIAGVRGIDVVLDPVGAEATDAAFRTLGWGGRHLMVGFAAGRVGDLKTSLTIVKGASLIGIDARRFREFEPENARRVFADIAAFHREGRIRPRLAAVFPFAEHAKAFAHASDPAHSGRVIFHPRA